MRDSGPERRLLVALFGFFACGWALVLLSRIRVGLDGGVLAYAAVQLALCFTAARGIHRHRAVGFWSAAAASALALGAGVANLIRERPVPWSGHVVQAMALLLPLGLLLYLFRHRRTIVAVDSTQPQPQ